MKRKNEYDKVNNNFIIKYLLEIYKEFRFNNKYQIINKETSVYSKQYFVRPK